MRLTGREGEMDRQAICVNDRVNLARQALRTPHILVIKGGKQPYAIGMKDGAPFGLAGLWENWKDLAADEWVRTFTIITVPSNEMIERIHDRTPAILRPADYERWLGTDPDPHDLLIIYPADPMKMWPISKRVNSPRNDDAELLDEIDLAAALAVQPGRA